MVVLIVDYTDNGLSRQSESSAFWYTRLTSLWWAIFTTFVFFLLAAVLSVVFVSVVFVVVYDTDNGLSCQSESSAFYQQMWVLSHFSFFCFGFFPSTWLGIVQRVLRQLICQKQFPLWPLKMSSKDKCLLANVCLFVRAGIDWKLWPRGQFHFCWLYRLNLDGWPGVDRDVWLNSVNCKDPPAKFYESSSVETISGIRQSYPRVSFGIVNDS